MKRVCGKIIAFDGPDGVGKTTQIGLTAAYLRECGYDVHTTRASGSTPIGERLREVSLSELTRPAEVDVYISLAMHTALGHDLQMRRSKGQICLVDRSPAAIVAYNVYGSQLEDKQLGLDAFRKMLDLWDTDLLLMINAGQDVTDDRRKKRTDKPMDYFEKQNASYHLRVRQGYKKAIELIMRNREQHNMLEEIDGSPSKTHVQQQIKNSIQKVL